MTTDETGRQDSPPIPKDDDLRVGVLTLDDLTQLQQFLLEGLNSGMMITSDDYFSRHKRQKTVKKQTG